MRTTTITTTNLYHLTLAMRSSNSPTITPKMLLLHPSLIHLMMQLIHPLLHHHQEYHHHSAPMATHC
jgi:hypothetical protein